MSLVQTEFKQATRLNLSGAADQLGFLLAQLEGRKIDAIVDRVERLADVDSEEPVVTDRARSGLSKHAQVQQAIARILYAVAGMSFEDRVFALTFAEIQAVLDGANDECFETAYRQ